MKNIIILLLFIPLYCWSLSQDDQNKKKLAIKLLQTNDIESLHKGIDYLEQMVEHDDATVIYLLTYYLTRPDLQTDYPNYQKIINLSKELINSSNVEYKFFGYYILAVTYRFSEDRKYKDIKESDKYFNQLYKLSKSNNDRYKLLYKMYLSGYGTKKNFNKALENGLLDIINEPNSNILEEDLPRYKEILKDKYKEYMNNEEKIKNLWIGRGSLEDFLYGFSAYLANEDL